MASVGGLLREVPHNSTRSAAEPLAPGPLFSWTGDCRSEKEGLFLPQLRCAVALLAQARECCVTDGEMMPGIVFSIFLPFPDRPSR